MLATDKIEKNFGGLKAVDQVSIEVKENTIMGLIGPNGAGKTTFFNLITGFHATDGGKITFKDRDITNLAPHEISKLGLVRTFQKTRIFPEMTVMENLIVAPQDNVGEGFFDPLFFRKAMKKDIKEKSDRAIEVLKEMDLYDQKDEYAKNLPYGEQKRLEMMRAVMTSPDLLLLDEPTAGVSQDYTESMKQYIKKLQQEKGITFLIIEHKMSFMMELAEYLYVIDHGKLIASGTPEEIKNDERVISAYLGNEVENK